MNKRIIRNSPSVVRLFLFLMLAAAGSSVSSVDGAGPIRVIVLPFKINAPQQLSYLGQQVADQLGRQLQAAGAEIVSLSPQEADETLRAVDNTAELTSLARRHQAGSIIWGSLTRIGESFSLDARMLTISTDEGPLPYHAEGRGLENLVNVIKELADQMSFKLFGRERISQVLIQGNQRIESDAIQRVIKTQPGGIYQPGTLSEDIRAVFAMGYFDDVRVTAESSTAGKIVTFVVKEKPVIRHIKYKGNLRFDDEKITENITLSTGAVLNAFKIRSNVEQIEKMYKEKNYHKAKADYAIEALENNQADLTFIIDEGPKLYVTEIVFEGNKDFTAKQLKKQMSTSEKGFFYWISSSGDLDRATLEQDAEKLIAFYHNNGYIEARVGEPRVDIREADIQITIKITEGVRYKVGEVSIRGDMILPESDLMARVAINKQAYYNREIVRQDVIALTDLYSNYGYANADIAPRAKEYPEKQLVDITYEIDKRNLVYFDKIYISGNTLTRDKVIRRELKVQEQERFDGAALKRSIRNLHRLDYFEDVKVDTIKGPTEDKMSLQIDVTEKPTGQFSFGAGYSSEENVFLTGSITQRNFLGRGQILRLHGIIGSETQRFSLGFTEPYLFDTNLSGTAELYNLDRDYDEYNQNSRGGILRFGYPLFDYTRLYMGYRYDLSDYDEIEDDAPDSIRQLQGTNLTSSVDSSLIYDSRDRAFNTTEGSKHLIAFEYAGFGGDIGFEKLVVETGWYIPLFKGFVGFVHAKAGYVEEIEDKLLPDTELFKLGGINSLRGFDSRGVHLTEVNELGNTVEVGGNYMAQFNIELIVPLYPKLGLNGVVFYDTGNVYEDAFDLGDLRESAGFGFRWYSPLAPIRIEYGHILDRREDEPSGQWEFTMGSSF